MLTAPSRRAAPADPLLSVTTLPRTRPGYVVVEVVGELDTHTAPVVEACLHSQATQRGVRELVVDLRKVTFLGAAGATVLARAHRSCRRRGVRLVLHCGGRRTVLRPLRLTGLTDLLVIDPPDHEPDHGRGRLPSPRRSARPRPPLRWSPPPHPRRVPAGRTPALPMVGKAG
jgi:anti-anti-sigma factor